MSRKLGEFPHTWAHQVRESGTSGNVSFQGTRFYSYSTCIGHLVRAKNGRQCVLLSWLSHSVTTAGHISAITAATSHLKQFWVASPSNKPGRLHVKFYSDRISQAKQALAKTNARGLPRRLSELKATVRAANDFCEEFGFKTRFTLPDDMEELQEQASKEYARTTARDAARIRKDEKRRKEEQAIRDAEKAKHLERWLAGESVRAPYVKPDRMRIVDSEVQTTGGASVTVKALKRIAAKVLGIVRKGGEWHRNGDTISVGDYPLDSIDADGTVCVGCHTFAKEEVERMAKLLGM